MGNAACCRTDLEDDKAMEKLQDKVHSEIKVDAHPPSSVDDDVIVPHLSQKTEKRIQTEKFFSEELNKQVKPHKKQYDKDIYIGDLDDSKRRPHGLGKMYKPDGGIYIGHFNFGKAQGKGAFIFKDGSFYQGEFFENCADDLKGTYKSDLMSYIGGFKNNTFHGEGEEDGKDYKYLGFYSNGARTQGVLTWGSEGQSYRYDGEFNSNNEFHGKGKLKEPKGEYQGDFVNGEKHGRGQYYSKSGFKYQGTYANGFRDGLGTIYNPDNTIYYKGQMQQDLPHGHGCTYVEGQEIKSTWVEGIDFKELPGQ